MDRSILRLFGSRRVWVAAVAGGIAFVVLWHLLAYRRGMLMAQLDHLRGH